MRKYHLLIVEDEGQLRDTLCDMFEELGYQVSTAINGQEGLEKMEAEAPDLIISDVAMPVMDGFSLLAKVKSSPSGKTIPVILLTAKVADEEKLHGLGLGADDYVTKPFDWRELRLRVENKLTLKTSLANANGKESSLPEEEWEQSAFIRSLTEYLDKHMHTGRLELATVAENFRLSESGLQKKITRLTGKSFSRFVREYRLRQAHRLLETNQFTIGEVAVKVGFSTNSYFSESFRDLFGYVPSRLLS